MTGRPRMLSLRMSALATLALFAVSGCVVSDSLDAGAGGALDQGPVQTDEAADAENSSPNESAGNEGAQTPDQTAMTDKYALWSRGTNLRGANLYQRRVYPVIDGEDFLGDGPIGPPVTQEDFTALAAMGANYVNLSHPGLFSEAPPYVLDSDVEQNLDRLIALAGNAGLYVVISFRTGPGRSEFAIFEGQDWFPASLVVNTVWTDATAQAAWSEMWAYAAARYRDAANVAGYDLMVEPNGSSTILGLWDPADFYPRYAGSLVDWNQMHASICAAVRVVDTQTPILVSAMSYGSPAWLPYLKIDESRTVATVHHYLPFEYTHQGAGEGARYPGTMVVEGSPTLVDRDWLANVLKPVDDYRASTGIPVAINEFGVKRWSPGADQYFTAQVGLFEERGINHALWLWEAAWTPLAEFDDFKFRHGADPSNHQDVGQSALMSAIRVNWRKNTVAPSAARLQFDLP